MNEKEKTRCPLTLQPGLPDNRPSADGWRPFLFPFFALVLILFIGLPASPAEVQSPKGTLRGTVTALDSDGNPFNFPGVNIKLTGAPPSAVSLSTFSGDDGKYEFVELPPGSYTLEAGLPGFKTVTRKVFMTPGATVEESIRLELAEVREEVEVREQAPTVAQQTPAPPATLTGPQLTVLPTLNQKFKETLTVQPGVIRSREGKINIKGAAENQGMLRIDSAEAVDPITGGFDVDLSVDAIQSVEVYKSPYPAEYGDFSGGLTEIRTRPPASNWKVALNDFNPSFRGKNGHLAGIAADTPRLSFSGPLVKNKLGFSESLFYDLRKTPVRGLAWPNNEFKREGYNSFTNFQYTFSPQHLLSVNVHVFPVKHQFANSTALIPQTASSDRGQRGVSVGGTDRYLFASGGALTTLFNYTHFRNYAHGQGPLDMLLTPNGWDGNFFNQFTRTSNQEEFLQDYAFPLKEKWGQHQVKIGGSVIHRSYDGTSSSHAVILPRVDGSVAGRIEFLGGLSNQTPGGETRLSAHNTETAVFIQDHWSLHERFALDLGLRYFTQSLGDSDNFDPRLGLIFSPDSGGKTIIRGGIGIFHDRNRLLAGDFANNPTRVVTLFDEQGVPLGPPQAFRNRCAQGSADRPRFLPSCSALDNTPYNLTFNAAVERKLGRGWTLRLGYLNSRTYNLFVVNPVLAGGTDPTLLLTNAGSSHYHEYEATGRWAGEGSTLNMTYLHSRSRGNQNTLGQIFVPFEQPVIRPDVYSNLPSDVPDRFTAWGVFKFPLKITFSPIVDWHSGFSFSKVDVLQNYVGPANSVRFPTFFTLNVRVTKQIHLPFPHFLRKYGVNVGIGSLNLTNHGNPTEVFNNVTSPFFGLFPGREKRVNILVINYEQ